MVVILNQKNKKITDSLKKSIEDELSRIDLIASNYKKDSELSKINAASLNQKILISSDMYSLLSFAENLFEITNGYYDVTLGSLVIEKGFGPEYTMVENTLPVSIKRFNLISNNKNIDLPDANTLWILEGNNKLSPNNPIKLVWNNNQGIKFPNNSSFIFSSSSQKSCRLVSFRCDYFRLD